MSETVSITISSMLSALRKSSTSARASAGVIVSLESTASPFRGLLRHVLQLRVIGVTFHLFRFTAVEEGRPARRQIHLDISVFIGVRLHISIFIVCVIHDKKHLGIGVETADEMKPHAGAAGRACLVVNINTAAKCVRRHQFDVLGRAFVFFIKIFQIIFRCSCNFGIAFLASSSCTRVMSACTCAFVRTSGSIYNRRIAAEIGKKIIYEFLAEPPGGYAREGTFTVSGRESATSAEISIYRLLRLRSSATAPARHTARKARHKSAPRSAALFPDRHRKKKRPVESFYRCLFLRQRCCPVTPDSQTGNCKQGCY